MSEEISYDEKTIPLKEVNPLMDSEMHQMRENAIEKLEKAQMDKQVRAEAGITEIPKEPESIPKELPQLAFKLGAKIIACEKFKLDDEESKIMAKHLSIIVGGINSKIYSMIIVVVIVISKVTTCMDSIKSKFGKKKENIEVPQSSIPNIIPSQKHKEPGGEWY